MAPTKILFCGYGRAGKDEAAAFIGAITTLRYAGSFSWAALPHMAAVLGVHPMVAWDTRHQNREVWKRELDKFREVDQCKLARMVLEQGEVAAGLRDKLEIDAVKSEGLFDYIVWIDRPGTPVDPTVTYGPGDCHETILNDGDLEKYHATLFEWCVRRSLPLKRTPETEKLFRNSRFYCWGGAFEERYLGAKNFNIGDE